jgi:hypothetical protein
VITVDLPDSVPVDWDDWRLPLQQFTEATGLVTSAYDAAGTRRIGPLTATRMGTLLASSTLWADDGPGTQLERTLVAATCASGDAAAAQFAEGMRVQTRPLMLRGEVYGVVVFGWRFADFSSPLACDRIAKKINLPGHQLWNVPSSAWAPMPRCSAPCPARSTGSAKPSMT